jgi:hypothetical protein
MIPQLEIFRRWVRSNWLLIFLLSVAIARLWLTPLPSSFWTDETGTFFVVQRPNDPSLAVAPQVPASIYYALPRTAERIFGFSEIAYRIPSVLLMGIALFMIGRLAARLIDRHAAWFAVFACFVTPNFNYYAADARPYALGICVTVASLYFLIDWLDTARWKSAALFFLFAALLWRVQLVFWAFYPVFPIYALVRLVRSSTKVGWIRAGLSGFVLAVALMPVAFEAVRILRNAGAHVIVPLPGIRSWLYSFPWKTVAYCAGLPWIAARLLKWRRDKAPSAATSIDAMTLIFAWWIWMPLCLFIWSRFTGIVLFLPRYFSPELPGAALAATAVAAISLPRARWRQASVVLAVAGLLWTGRLSVLWPHHSPDNWRQGAADVNLKVEELDTPVIAVSPFIEAQPPVWTSGYSLPGFLYAPLLVYPVRGRIYPFPYLPLPDGEEYAAKLLRDTLAKCRRFIVYGPGPNASSWADWFSGRTDLSGWRHTATRAEAIAIIVFENPASTPDRNEAPTLPVGSTGTTATPPRRSRTVY